MHHGELDNIIPARASQQIVEALEKAGGSNVSFTLYPDLMHDSWTTAYENIEVYRWMLKQQRPVKGEELEASEAVVNQA